MENYSERLPSGRAQLSHKGKPLTLEDLLAAYAAALSDNQDVHFHVGKKNQSQLLHGQTRKLLNIIPRDCYLS